jgi:hypothetical protein
MTTRILTLIALVSAGCVAQNSPVRVTGVFSPGGDDGKKCELSGNIQQFGGSIDASGSLAYFLLTTYSNGLQAIETLDPRGNTIADSTRNNFIVDTLVLNYATKGAGAPALPKELQVQRIPITAVMEAGGVLNSLFNVISSPMADFLSANVNKGDSFLLSVNYFLSGYVSSASSGGRLDSNAIDFPITVRRQFDPCPAGNFIAPNGPCNTGGVNGARVICCDPAAMPLPTGCVP